MRNIGRRRTDIITVGGIVAVVGAGFLLPFAEHVASHESNDLWPNPYFIVPLAALVFGMLVVGAMMFVPDPAEGEKAAEKAAQTERDEVRRKTLAAMERIAAQLSHTGLTGPELPGTTAAELRGPTGATGPALDAALVELEAEGAVERVGLGPTGPRFQIRGAADLRSQGQMEAKGATVTPRTEPVTPDDDPVTRREQVMDVAKPGRVAGEEIVHKSGRRDATAMPETVAAGARIEKPQGRATDRLAERCLALSKEMYEFIEPMSSGVGGAIAATTMLGVYRTRFEARLLSLYPDLRRRGLSDENLAFLSAPVYSVSEVRRNALNIGMIGHRLIDDAEDGSGD